MCIFQICVSAINIYWMNMNVYTQTYMMQHAHIHLIWQILVAYLLNINLGWRVMEIYVILFCSQGITLKGRQDMLIIILVVFLKVWSLAQKYWHHLGTCEKCNFFFNPLETSWIRTRWMGVQQLMFLKFPQGSLMNIKVSEQLELQESFSVLQELEITLNWGHSRRVEEGGGIWAESWRTRRRIKTEE